MYGAGCLATASSAASTLNVEAARIAKSVAVLGREDERYVVVTCGDQRIHLRKACTAAHSMLLPCFARRQLAVAACSSHERRLLVPQQQQQQQSWCCRQQPPQQPWRQHGQLPQSHAASVAAAPSVLTLCRKAAQCARCPTGAAVTYTFSKARHCASYFAAAACQAAG